MLYLWNFVKIDIYFFHIFYPKFWAHGLFQNDIVTILSKHIVIIPLKYENTNEKVLKAIF